MNSTRLFSRTFRGWVSRAAGCLLVVAHTSAQTPPTGPASADTPTAAAASPTAAPEAGSPAITPPAERGRVLYPANGPQSSPGNLHSGGETGTMPGLATSFVMLLALCAGGYYLVRRQAGFVPVGKGQRKLVVSESRSLGNRQFLVVVEYENERVLLGITPGKIDYLCPLPATNTPAGPVFKERVS